MANPTLSTRDDDDESGISLIEIVIAMFLLAIVAIAILPAAVRSVTLASTNVALTTASQLADQEMDIARGLSRTCSAVTGYANETIGLLTTDPRGAVLRIHRETINNCTSIATYPAAVPFVVWVTIDGKNQKLVSSKTMIYLQSAS